MLSSNAAAQTCPLSTTQRLSPLEEAHRDVVPEVRAYKLGKQRWSYNQCEILFVPEGSAKAAELTSVETWQPNPAGRPHQACDSQVWYHMRLSNKVEVSVVLFLVHSQPCEQKGDGTYTDPQEFEWTCVSRGECKKGCEGPLLRPLKRTGLVSSKASGPDGSCTRSASARRQVKDARYIHVAIDEACTHVGVKNFRLIAGVYDKSQQQLLGTACSLPIRVVSNNDAPGGAAHITLSASIRKDWSGWRDSNLHRQLDCMSAAGAAQTPGPIDRLSSMQASAEHSHKQDAANGRAQAAQGTGNQIKDRIAVPLMDFRPFVAASQEPSGVSLQDQLASCSSEDLLQQSDFRIANASRPAQDAAGLGAYNEVDIDPESLLLKGRQQVGNLRQGCPSPILTLPNTNLACSHQRQDAYERAVALPSPASAIATAGLTPFVMGSTEHQLLGLAPDHLSQQQSACSQQSSGTGLHDNSDALPAAGFAFHSAQQQQDLNDVCRSDLASSAMLGMLARAETDTLSFNRASHSCHSSSEGQQQQSQGQLSASKSEAQNSGLPFHRGYDSMPHMGGVDGHAQNGQALKRKQSSNSVGDENSFELARVQRELIFTQHELQLLRMQYFQLRQVCHDSVQGFNGSRQPSILAKQPGCWQAVAAPVNKRQAILSQDLDLLQVPAGQWWPPQQP